MLNPSGVEFDASSQNYSPNFQEVPFKEPSFQFEGNAVSNPNVKITKLESSLTLQTAVHKSSLDSARRAFDVLASASGLVVLSPVLLAIALTVRVSSPGQILFKQSRLTAGGRKFSIYKFRSMQENAEKSTGAVWAADRDPRVTKIGRVLRRTRLDELPQLYNVLRGDMSVVGPRPERPELAIVLAKEYPSFKKRLQVKAGLTGLAQVNAGYCSSVESYRQKLAFDRLYIQRRSILLDLKIIVKTMKVVLSGSGAR